MSKVFKEFEINAIKLLLQKHLDKKTIELISSYEGEFEYEYTGSGYFLSINAEWIPKNEIVISVPFVVGRFDKIQAAFVIFIRNNEFTLECHTCGEISIPANFRSLDVKIDTIKPNIINIVYDPSKRKTKIKRLFIAFFILALISIFWFLYNENRRIVKNILQLKNLPSSISDIECISWGLTDVLTKCAFKVSPKEFDSLLKGWHFSKKSYVLNISSHYYEPTVGKEFLINKSYIVYPKEYTKGGYVQVFTDANKTNVLIDMYIE